MIAIDPSEGWCAFFFKLGSLLSSLGIASFAIKVSHFDKNMDKMSRRHASLLRLTNILFQNLNINNDIMYKDINDMFLYLMGDLKPTDISAITDIKSKSSSYKNKPLGMIIFNNRDRILKFVKDAENCYTNEKMKYDFYDKFFFRLYSPTQF